MKRTRIGAIVFAARKKQGLTTRDVSKLSGGKISYPYVSDIENYEYTVSPEKLKILAKALNIDYLKLMKTAGYL